MDTLERLRSLFEPPICKARIERLAESFGNEVLSVEHTYLRHLLFRAIPSRLPRSWRPAVLAHTAAIVLCIVSTGAGYLAGRRLSRERPATRGNLDEYIRPRVGMVQEARAGVASLADLAHKDWWKGPG